MYTEKNSAEVSKQSKADKSAGLTPVKVEEARKKFGLNKLVEQKKKSVFVLFMEQLQDPLIYILMAAIAISLFLGEAGDSMIIAAVILLNSIVGVVQEDKARKAIEALKQLTSPKALVRRDGREMEIPGEELVPGDIVILEAGRQVPADLLLLQAVNMKIEESALTGESVPVEKTDQEPKGEIRSIGDRTNMAFMSTQVTYGRGEGVVTATGMDTEIGKIAGLIDRKGN
ncbi:MAG: HAD-IC family P-type ATPase, partial [Lachnospiraceae bacterium]|nr:HAD-IC family P-type ATPase [Lachnospiraceae bacterium]